MDFILSLLIINIFKWCKNNHFFKLSSTLKIYVQSLGLKVYWKLQRLLRLTFLQTLAPHLVPFCKCNFNKTKITVNKSQRIITLHSVVYFIISHVDEDSVMA